MKSKLYSKVIPVLLLAVITASCGIFPTAKLVQATQAAQAAQPSSSSISSAGASGGLVQITGSFTYSNPIAVETYYVEQSVALVDMTGFVKRDQKWELPVNGQVLGFLSIDTQKKQGTYHLDLPIAPEGDVNDVSHGTEKGKGVQIFAVSYSPNLTGGPFAEGDDRSLGWPNYLASVKTDSGNHDEVVGGSLVVWAPDSNELFPTGFGSDGLLFTKDDPVAALPAGYSVINLDTKPFKIVRDPQVALELFEPNDVAIKDFSSLSYSDAFDQTFAIVKKEYAFNGFPNKVPNWDTLYQEISPKVKTAQTAHDATAYYKALLEFTGAFKDGHTGLDGGDIANQVIGQMTTNGYGLALRQLDDGSVVVVYVTKSGPADQAGIKTGAQVTAFGGKPINDAAAAINPPLTFSTDFARRYQQLRYLTRAGNAGDKADITFKNPGSSQQTATLQAIKERSSFSAISLYSGYNPNALPVEFSILDTGVGYVRVNSNYDDLNLIERLFNRALNTFQANQVPGIIIDMRLNQGGAPLGLAGFLTNKDIPEGQLQYYSEKTGKFENEGPPDKFTPMTEQYKFAKEVLLVNQSCYSACELEAYGFSQVPGMVVMGQYPSAGVEAEVSRGQFKLPENFSLQVPTGRFLQPDGSLFLEGKGVQPTKHIPVDAQSVLSTQDVVLQAAELYITGQ